jgi:hypothetical protein
MFLDGDKSLLIYCNGKNTPISMKYIEEEDKYMSCTANIYGLNEEMSITSLEQAKAIIKDNMYDIALECNRYPDEIIFSISSDTDLNYIIEGIKNVCKKKKKTLYIKYPYAEE